VAYRYSLREADVPDLLQEIRIALWKSGVTNRVNPAWLFRVISNKAVDFIRRMRRARECDEILAQTHPAAPVDPDLEHLLHARVAELPIRLRDFYRLRYVEGWTEREIASRLRLCRASIRWMDHCCRTQIVGERKSAAVPDDSTRHPLPSQTTLSRATASKTGSVTRREASTPRRRVTAQKGI
jgi:RNA polymerase sigma factor (sigma-70 family)